jgi:type III pantothenate kinase
VATVAEARLVADLGNSRLKWGLVGPDGRLIDETALPLDDEAAWEAKWTAWVGPNSRSHWAISTVNPPIAERLTRFLAGHRTESMRWFRSAADVPVAKALDHPETAGADRALAVAEATYDQKPGRCGQVISCGTAITVEWVDEAQVWRGGAITAGMGLLARALNVGTAQLPAVGLDADGPPAAIGRSTVPTLRAGIYWGVIGGVRELLARQSEGHVRPWRIWTGGDAVLLAEAVEGSGAVVVPDLVLRALARMGLKGLA